MTEMLPRMYSSSLFFFQEEKRGKKLFYSDTTDHLLHTENTSYVKAQWACFFCKHIMCETGVTEQTLKMTIDLPSLQLLRRIRLGGTEGVSGSRLRFSLAAYIFSGVLAAKHTYTHFSLHLSAFTNYSNDWVCRRLGNLLSFLYPFEGICISIEKAQNIFFFSKNANANTL